MKIKGDKNERFEEYSNLQGILQKKSSNMILGFQPKKWEIFDKGKKIGYRNIKDAEYLQQNIFLIKDCEVSEEGKDTDFQLIAKDRQFVLRAENKQLRDKWISGITYLKQLPRRQKKTKKKRNEVAGSITTITTNNNPNDESRINPEDMSFSTERDLGNSEKIQPKFSEQKLPVNQFSKSKVEQPLNNSIMEREKHKKNEKSLSEPITLRNGLSKTHHPEDLETKLPLPLKINKIIEQLARYLPKHFIKYNTMLTQLKTRHQGFFSKNDSKQSCYILISCKSMYPNVHINEQNLTNLSLPPWIEVNIISEIDIVNQKCVSKPICHVNKIIEVELSENDNSFKINTGQILYDFLAETKEQRECIKNCINLAIQNNEESIIDGKISKINYDKLVYLHELSHDSFKEQVQKIILTLLPPSQSLKDIDALLNFLEAFNNFVKQFLKILSHKKQIGKYSVLQTIQDTLKILYDELKVQVKLTWDSLYPRCLIKTFQILSVLQYLSDFSLITKDYVRSQQLIEGMKQLSKIYVRDAWKNFQNIIINIVQLQKKSSSSQDFILEEGYDWIRTKSVDDLFRQIYEVFQIAIPHWKSKIHLRNVSKLVLRALQAFVSEIRSMVGQEYIPDKYLVGMANNYIKFNEYVREFYEQKISELHEQTEDDYKKVAESYREISLIIIDKLTRQVNEIFSQYMHNRRITSIKSEDFINQLLVVSQKLSNFLHIAFRKKFYDKIAMHLHSLICDSLLLEAEVSRMQKEKKGKDKKDKKNTKNAVVSVTQLCEYLRIVTADITEILKDLGKSHMTFSRFSKEVTDLLTEQLHSDLKGLINSTQQPLKSKYLTILYLRKDYFPQSELYLEINQIQLVRSRQKSVRVRTPTANKHRKRSADISAEKDYKNRRISFTMQYQEEQMAANRENRSDTSSINGRQENEKLISCGYMTKGKTNKKIFEKEYFRLKNGVLYIFEKEDSDRCTSSISVNKITDIRIKNEEKPSFYLTYTNMLDKQKEIKFRCESLELRDRWVMSLKLQMKRISNEEKIKKKKLVKTIEAETGRKKNQFIIDYWQLQGGTDYFSYSQV